MEDASRLANELEPRFSPLERWANRALAAETVPMAVDAFDARLFAPTLEDASVVEAFLARTGTAPIAISSRGSASPVDDAHMTGVRLPDGRRMRVGFARLDDPRTSEADPIEVVVLEHTSHPSATETISFAVAFADVR